MRKPEHRLTFNDQPDGMVSVNCVCGWHATSAGEQLAHWNADGHMSDVFSAFDSDGPLPDYLEERRYRERMEDLDPLATFPWDR
jgi:hypothetical protein